jgi:hypothetical protein
MNDFRLWEIDGMLREAIAAAEGKIGEDGVIPDDWAEFLDTVQMERDKKCLAVAAMYREFDAEAEAISEEAKRLVARARTCGNKADRLKQYLASVVQVGEKLKDTRVQITWRKSSAVIIDDESKLPEACFQVVRSVSKTVVKEGLQSGAVKEGAHIETNNHLQIR